MSQSKQTPPVACARCDILPCVEIVQGPDYGSTEVNGVFCGFCESYADDIDGWNERQLERRAEDDPPSPEHDS